MRVLIFLQKHKNQLIATGMVLAAFVFFIVNGPLLQLKDTLHFEKELTSFSKPKFVGDKKQNTHFSGFISEVETAGFGHSLLLNQTKSPVKYSQVITESQTSEKIHQDSKQLLEHAKKLFGTETTYKLDTHTEFPFVLLKSNTETNIYFETCFLPHHIKGYAGPINVAIVLQADGKLKSIHHIFSSETESYLQKINAAGFYHQFATLNLAKHNEIDGVSGATLTTSAISETVLEGIRTMAEHSLDEQVDLSSVFMFDIMTVFGNLWILHVIVIAMLIWFGIQKNILKKSKKSVLYVRLFSICYLGFYLNNSFTFTTMLHPFLGTSLSVMVSVYLALVLIGAIWGKNVYCKYVCPFGNAQCLVLQASPKSWRADFFLSNKILKWMRASIGLVLLAGIILGQDRWKNFELFPDLFGVDYMSFWFFVATLFVLLSIRHPMLWCRSLCPTGWILDTTQQLSQEKISFPSFGKMTLKFVPFLVLFSCVTFTVNTADGQHTLRIVEKQNSMPIPNAHITVTDEKGNSITFLTDLDGRLAFKYLQSVKLSISSLGFRTLKMKFDADSNLNSTQTFTLEEEIQTLNEVVITAQFAENSPEKAVHKIKIIDRKRIEQQGAVNLKDVLAQENNIRISEDNILGSGMTMQGTGGQNVKLLVDGVPVVGRLDGNIDLSQLNMNQVERIEIVEGPLSVNYGTDALAGTINIITKKNQAKPIELSYKSYYESVGQYNMSFEAGYKFKKQRVSLSGLRNNFDGWSPVDTSRFQQWKPKLQYSTKGQYQYMGDKTNWRLSSEIFDETITNKGQPRAPYFETAFDDVYKTTRLNNALSSQTYLGKKKELNILVAYNFYQRQKNTYFRDLTTLEKSLTQNAEDQDTTQFQLLMSRGTYAIPKDSSFASYQFGYDVNIESTMGKKIQQNSQKIGDYALFANTELKLRPTLLARIGMRYGYNTTYKNPLIPSLNLKYNWKNWVARASYARGFRAPSLKELYFNFVDFNHNLQGNSTLKAETSHNFQTNLTWQNQVTNQTLLKAEVALFYNTIQDLITLSQVVNSTSYQYFNIGKYKTQGVSLNLNASYNHLKLTFGTTLNGRQYQLTDSTKVLDFAYSSEFRANALYEWYKTGLTFSLFYKYNGANPRFYTEDNDLKLGKTAAYQLADFIVSKSLWKKKITLTSGIKNIFDVKQVVSTGAGSAHSDGGGSTSVAWGRSYFVSASISF